MKLPCPSLLFALSVFVAVSPGLLSAAEATPTAAGYWDGSITLPTQNLPIAIELASGTGSVWQGTIDIPLQGMHGFKLDAVKVEAAMVEFAMPGIPGDPRFIGKLAADAKTISGDFSQGGASFPFQLERKTKPAPRPIGTPVPEHGVPGKGLAGRWLGSIKPLPAMELRLGLELAPDSAGKLEGVLVSIDQGNGRIPVSGLTEVDGKVQFETPRVQGQYSGQMSADGSEMVGEWSQGGRATPLVFKRLTETAGTP